MISLFCCDHILASLPHTQVGFVIAGLSVRRARRNILAHIPRKHPSAWADVLYFLSLVSELFFHQRCSHFPGKTGSDCEMVVALIHEKSGKTFYLKFKAKLPVVLDYNCLLNRCLLDKSSINVPDCLWFGFARGLYTWVQWKPLSLTKRRWLNVSYWM